MATTIPTGFHRVSGSLSSYVKGHIYFFKNSGRLCIATDTTEDGLEQYSSGIKNVMYNPSMERLTLTYMDPGIPITYVDLSVYAKQTQVGTLSDLDTTAKSDLVSAINEVLAAVDAGGSGSVVTVTESTPSGYAKSYTIKQGGSTVGTINIPKDMVVSSGTVETNPSGKPTGTYLVLTLANATSDKVYINVGTLVDIYTAQQSATKVQLAIDPETRVISASIVAGAVTTTELANSAVTTSKLASGAVTLDKLAVSVQSSLDKASTALQKEDIATGEANGTISVGGTDVPVKGLSTCAYLPDTFFMTPEQVATTVNAARTQMQTYADSLHNWLTWEE